jgi:hypothetical protein
MEILDAFTDIVNNWFDKLEPIFHNKVYNMSSTSMVKQLSLHWYQFLFHKTVPQ